MSNEVGTHRLRALSFLDGARAKNSLSFVAAVILTQVAACAPNEVVSTSLLGWEHLSLHSNWTARASKRFGGRPSRLLALAVQFPILANSCLPRR